MLRIQRSANGNVTFSLSGRMEAKDVDALRGLLGLESSQKRIVLNLRELVLVDSDAMEFLAECEAAGRSLEDCPGFVRTWIDQWKAESECGKAESKCAPLSSGQAVSSEALAGYKSGPGAKRRVARNAGKSHA